MACRPSYLECCYFLAVPSPSSSCMADNASSRRSSSSNPWERNSHPPGGKATVTTPVTRQILPQATNRPHNKLAYKPQDHRQIAHPGGALRTRITKTSHNWEVPKDHENLHKRVDACSIGTVAAISQSRNLSMSVYEFLCII